MFDLSVQRFADISDSIFFSGVNIDGKILKVETNMHIAEICLKLILHMYIFIPQKFQFFHLEHQWGF